MARCARFQYARQHPEFFSTEPSYLMLEPEQGRVRIFGFFNVMAEARARGEIASDLNYLRFEGVQVDRGIVTINSSRVYGIDATNGWDVARGDREARRQNQQLFTVIKKYIPGCENCYLLASALIGVRETRRIRGAYVLDEADFAAHRTHPDTVASIWRWHSPGTELHSPDGNEGGVGHEPYRSPQQNKRQDWFEIPYRALIPNGIDGLLVGGRILSQTQLADMYTRNQDVCMVTGQAAGTAAALAAKSGVTPRALAVRELQDALVRQGVKIRQDGVNIGAA